jgi:ABC-type dipeptide/oligopeptide/nickel transport system permease subunit
VKKNWLVNLAIGFLVFMVFFALFGPMIKHDPLKPVGDLSLGPSAQFWFGTDEQGRDVFARVAFGARMSLIVGLTVLTLSLLIGVFVGVCGVFAPKWIREPLMRFTDGMFAFPDILLAILIMGLWKAGLIPVIVALAITAWPSMARLIKTQVTTLKEREFVTASIALGMPTWRVILRHILPHLISTVIAVSMIELSGAILAESALSFLGIGVQPPTPSWGTMIKDSREQLESNPMLILWPCLALSLTILSLNIIGDYLRDRFDPKRAST